MCLARSEEHTSELQSLTISYAVFCFSCAPPLLHSFPTRRSSDLDLVRLPLLRRWLADLPGRHLHVLFLQRAKHIRRCQSALSQFRRVEPQAKLAERGLKATNVLSEIGRAHV